MTDSRFGVRSMVAPLRRVMVSRPAAAGDWLGAGWREPDADALAREHDAFCATLAGLGAELVFIDEPAGGLVDSCFAYDPCFVTRRGAIVLQMAKPARVPEPARMERAFAAAGVPVIGRLEGEAVADGGDMFWLDEDTLAVGRGYRTNHAAHVQLRALLDAEGAKVERFDLPHHLGASHVMHLMSVVSPLHERLAAVFEPLAPVPLLEALAERSIATIPVDEDEWLTQGSNILTVRPGVVVMAAGNPKTRRALEAKGVEVHEYAAAQINKGDGGPTCLTRPLWRG